MDDLLRLGLDSMEFGVDPLLFAVPALFVFGFGLLLLRLYPWIVRLIYWAGRSRWRPSLYSSLLLVARRSNQYHPLMLFLILTLGMSIFNVSAARTLNMNLEEQILYRYGADIVLQQQWQDDAPMIVPGMEPVEMPDPEEIHYLEPPFEIIESLPEVEHAAKVFVKDDVYARIDKAYQRVRLMAIETDEFGRTAWMKQGLLPYDFYEYLNLIAPNPHSVLISRTMAEQMEIGPGDTLEIAWEGEQFLAVVYGVIDYFPSFNPNPSAKKADAEKQAPAPMLVVAHLETVQNNLVLQPYDVWIKLKEGATAQQLVESLEEKRVILTKFIDVKGEIAQSRNDPFRMAINGVMSLGLVLSLMVSLTGFLLYWVLSMRARALQLGVLRAMGISFGGMVGMLAAEQLLTSGAGMLIGLISGAAAAVLFVPLFQLSFDPGQIVPPFEVWIRAGDTLQMVVIMLTMLAAALIALGILLKRLKIHQAVKLGED
jgi:putative ABC transport system permease protein